MAYVLERCRWLTFWSAVSGLRSGALSVAYVLERVSGLCSGALSVAYVLKRCQWLIVLYPCSDEAII